jgi:hypothetical protein
MQRAETLGGTAGGTGIEKLRSSKPHQQTIPSSRYCRTGKNLGCSRLKRSSNRKLRSARCHFAYPFYHKPAYSSRKIYRPNHNSISTVWYPDSLCRKLLAILSRIFEGEVWSSAQVILIMLGSNCRDLLQLYVRPSATPIANFSSLNFQDVW